MAAFDDNTFVVSYLIEKTQFPIDQTDQQGNTALHWACDHNATFTPSWLLAFGANINAVNHEGNTPLHMLVKNPQKLKSSKQVRMLIFKGADRDIKNDKGMTALELLKNECDILEENGDFTIGQALRKELEQMLGKQSCYLPCCQIQ